VAQECLAGFGGDRARRHHVDADVFLRIANGRPPALTHKGGDAPAIRACDIRQISTRSIDAGERLLIKRRTLPVYDMRRIEELGIKQVMEQALEGVDENTHIHVTFDVDFLDPSITPGVVPP